MRAHTHIFSCTLASRGNQHNFTCVIFSRSLFEFPEASLSRTGCSNDSTPSSLLNTYCQIVSMSSQFVTTPRSIGYSMVSNDRFCWAASPKKELSLPYIALMPWRNRKLVVAIQFLSFCESYVSCYSIKSFYEFAGVCEKRSRSTLGQCWDGTGSEFESWQCRIYIPCS